MRRHSVARWLVLILGTAAGLVALAGAADARQIGGLTPGIRQADNVGARLAEAVDDVSHSVTPSATVPANGNAVVNPQTDATGSTFRSTTSTGNLTVPVAPQQAEPVAVEPVDTVEPMIHDGSGAVAGNGAAFAVAGDAFAGAGFGAAFSGTDDTFASAGLFDLFGVDIPFTGTGFFGTPFFGSPSLGGPIWTTSSTDSLSPNVLGGGLIQVGPGGGQALFDGPFGGTLITVGPGGTQFLSGGLLGGVLFQNGPAGFSLLFGGAGSGTGVSPVATPNLLGGGLIQFGPAGGSAIFGGTLFSFSPAGFQLLFGGLGGLSPMQDSEFSSSVGTPVSPIGGFGTMAPFFGSFTPFSGAVDPGFGVPGIDFTSGLFRTGLDLPGLDLPSSFFFLLA